MTDAKESTKHSQLNSIIVIAGVIGLALIGGLLGGAASNGFASIGSEAWAAVLGAIVGTFGTALVTFGMEVFKWRKERQDRADEESKNVQLTGKILMFKMSEIFADALSTHSGIVEDTKARSQETQFAAIYIRAPLHISEKVDLSAQESVLLYDLDPEFFMSVLTALDTFNQLSTALRQWRLENDQLFRNIPASIAGDPKAIEGYLRIHGGYALLSTDNIVHSVIDMAEEAKEALGAIVIRLRDLLSEKLELEIPIEIYDPDVEKSSGEIVEGKSVT